MLLQRLKERQDRINRKEFPFKCEEHNLKLFYDKKIKACKTEKRLIKNKISEEYKITTITKDLLNEYVAHILSLIFNKNNYPKEKDAIRISRNIIDLLQKYQDEKAKLFIEEKEKIEEIMAVSIEKEDKREIDMIESGFQRIDSNIKYFNKLKDDFFNKDAKNVSIRQLSDKFSKLVEENRKVKLDFKMVKITYEKILKIYKKEIDNYIKLKKHFENLSGDLFTTRIISTGNRFDIFNSINNISSKTVNLNINIKNPTYSTSSTINQEKKCLSQQNFIKKKIINKKLALNKNFKKKKYLTIKTDNDFNTKKPIKRIFSANSLTNKNIIQNRNKTNEEIYLKNVIDYLKQRNFEKNKYIKKLRLSISDELKTLIWVKNFISKLINELRYDIDDIKYYISNDENNKQLQKELRHNEKLLFFCIYFYDNCINGSYKTKYYINNIHNKDIKEEFKKKE